MKLWLDDIRIPPEGWTWAKNFQEAIDILTDNEVEEIELDHDLGKDHYVCQKEEDYDKIPEKSGYDVLLWIVQRKMDGYPVPKIFKIHSMNPVGVSRMRGVIERYLT